MSTENDAKGGDSIDEIVRKQTEGNMVASSDEVPETEKKAVAFTSGSFQIYMQASSTNTSLPLKRAKAPIALSN